MTKRLRELDWEVLVADGAPRLHLIGLRFVEGLAIRIDGGELDVDDCVFDGNRTNVTPLK